MNLFEEMNKVIESDMGMGAAPMSEDDPVVSKATVVANTVELSDVNKAVLFMHMMKKMMGATAFRDFLLKYGTELETYGFIPDAEKAKTNHCAYMDARGNVMSPVVFHAAMDLAANAGDELFNSYMDIERREHEVMDAIVQKYGSQATAEVNDMLKEFQQKAASMNFADADVVRNVVEKAIAVQGVADDQADATSDTTADAPQE